LPTAAWGLASYPQDGHRPAELVMVADQVMYRGKENKDAHSCQVGMSAD
jgi:PleD family two-component response regulator